MIKNESKSEDLRMDAMMESDRVRDIERIAEREKLRKLQQRQGAEVIRTQINERAEARLLDQEKKDQETKLILKQIHDMAEQDRSAKQKKILKQKQLMDQVGLDCCCRCS